jgi:hypothetical protein
MDFFKHMCATTQECEVADTVEMELMTMREEVKWVAECDLYITPGGGGSFSGVFVREGSTVAYGNACWPKDHKKMGFLSKFLLKRSKLKGCNLPKSNLPFVPF